MLAALRWKRNHFVAASEHYSDSTMHRTLLARYEATTETLEKQIQELRLSTPDEVTKPWPRSTRRHDIRTIKRKPIPQQVCVICADTKTSSKFPAQPPSSQCDHRSGTCKRCLSMWTRTCISHYTAATPVTCPECSVVLEHDEIRALIPLADFER